MLSNQNVQTENDNEELPAETLEQLYDKVEDLKEQLDQQNNPGKQ